MAKHVIILGAGASFTSGYPLANELRLLIGSENYFREKARNSHEDYKKNTPFLNDIKDYNSNPADYCFRSRGDAVSIFRQGGFGSIDEFCKLIAVQKDEQTGRDLSPALNKMRHLTRLALAVHNPEHNYEKSDYYPFIQRLFEQDLVTLRDDLTILTFNYDPYLEFLLLRAVRQRMSVRAAQPAQEIIDSVTSGLFTKNTQWMQSTPPKFKLLKLHGGVCTDQTRLDWLFNAGTNERIEVLAGESWVPPILFPWEVITEDGEFHPTEKFFLAEYASLFQAVWKTAREELRSASKISFVGFLMHSFLFNTLDYLLRPRMFELRSGRALKVVVADPTHESAPEEENFKINRHQSPYSPIRKLDVFLRSLEARLRGNGVEVQPVLNGCQFYPRRSFRDFIEKEMEPVPD